ncbi:hypothetical protein RRG08_036643 [Elysia crispata]|uniref:Uncharacterized protein n=1 Tax=Elysia crispata TaxID=231223 RepID=A0AAE0ZWI3_9GAST|nr:hypothetical protein RRG08_036643 [Elysia crispata]
MWTCYKQVSLTRPLRQRVTSPLTFPTPLSQRTLMPLTHTLAWSHQHPQAPSCLSHFPLTPVTSRLVISDLHSPLVPATGDVTRS